MRHRFDNNGGVFSSGHRIEKLHKLLYKFFRTDVGLRTIPDTRLE